MSLPPPSAFPPPTPPTAPVPAAGSRRTWLIVGALLAVLVVAAVVAGGNGGGSTTPDRDADFMYDWSVEVCNSDGLSGRFTNDDTKEFNGKVWAVARRDGAVVARDEEAVFGLAPGQSEIVEFVWVEDGQVTCAIESVDWRY